MSKQIIWNENCNKTFLHQKMVKLWRIFHCDNMWYSVNYIIISYLVSKELVKCLIPMSSHIPPGCGVVAGSKKWIEKLHITVKVLRKNRTSTQSL